MSNGKHGNNSHKGLVILIVVILIVAILAVGGFVFRSELSKAFNNAKDTIIGTTTTTTTTVSTTEPTTTSPISQNVIKAEEYVEKMSLNEKVCQLFVVTPEQLTGVDVATIAGETTKSQLKKYPVGGIVYYPQNVESKKAFNEMIDTTQSYSKTPLFIMKNGSKTTFTYKDQLQVSDSLAKSKNIKKDVLTAFDDGNQIILMPKDLKTAVKTITSAVKNGKIKEEDLEVAVAEIINTKYENGIMK